MGDYCPGNCGNVYMSKGQWDADVGKDYCELILMSWKFIKIPVSVHNISILIPS